MIRASRMALVWLLCALSARADGAPDGETLKYSGHGTRTQFQGGVAGASGTFDFSVQKSGCSWRIVIGNTSTFYDYKNGTYTPTYITAEYQSDGRHIISQVTSKMSGDPDEIVSKTINLMDSKIFTEAYPPEDTPGLQAVWTGFASGCNFAPLYGKGRSPFMEDEDVFSDPVLQPDYLFTNEPALPGHQIILNASGFMADRTPDGRITHYKLGPPFDKGYVTARGAWTPATVNGHGISNFVFNIYSPSYPAKSATNVVLQVSVNCVITNIVREPLTPVSIVVTNELALQYDRNQGGFGLRGTSKVAPVKVAYINGTRVAYSPKSRVTFTPATPWNAYLMNKISSTSMPYRIAVVVVLVCPPLVVASLKFFSREKTV